MNKMNNKLLGDIRNISDELNKKSRGGSGSWFITSATIANAISNLLKDRNEIRKSKISSIYE